MEESILKAVYARLLGSLLNELLYFWKAKKHIELLRNELKSLDHRKELAKVEVDKARDNVEVIAPKVSSWLKVAEKEKEEAEFFLGGLRNSHSSCYSTFKCLNLKLRYSIGKKAAMMASAISRLALEGVVHYPRNMTMPALIGHSYDSRMSIETEIMEALLDESISVIGVCGMVGVGKRTTIETIANDVLKNKIFDKVVKEFVPQNPDIMQIQDQLASRLDVSLTDESSVVKRAETLKMQLMNEPSRILIILNDTWKELDLSTIGFPDKDWPKGLKVIVSSRQLDVCRKMVQKIIQVEPLSEEESWSLFKQVAEINDTPEEIQEIAKILANKCYGLPLAVVSIGTKLRDVKELHAWNDFRNKLDDDQGNLEPLQIVFKRIELSYKSLHFELKSLLLICSLFPENYEISIEDLARYAMGLQLFKGINSLLQSRREKLEQIINMLTDCFLLLKCGNDRVKLHGIVRLYCLSIASARKGMPIGIQKDANESCNAMSLGLKECDLLSSQLKSSQLQLLRLSSGEEVSSVSRIDFLQGMEKLEVLDIESIRLQLSQTSVQSLVSLRTLNLNHCRLENDLSAIASLQNIEILSFYGSTYVGKFPNEIKELKHLKSLDLRFLEGPPDPLPSGILIHFKGLEELYLGSLITEKITAELVSLSHLNTIQVLLDRYYGLAQLVKSLEVDRLTRFCIFVGHPDPEDRGPYHFMRRLSVEEVSDDIALDPKIKALARKCVDGLVLRKIKGVTDLVDEGNDFQELKTLELEECDMKYLGNATDSTTPESTAFVELEKLYIRRAAKLEEIYTGNIPPKSFCKLQEVIMSDVPHLTYLWNPKHSPNLTNLRKLDIDGGKLIRSLFSRALVKCLYRLQIIKITNCPKLETIISSDDQEGRDTQEDIAQFAKLEEVYLDGVLSFRRFYTDLLNNEVKQPSTRILSCAFPKLQYMRVSRSERLEIVFDFEGLVRNIGQKESSKGLFYHLNLLQLSDLPQLKRLWGMLPKYTIAFQNLATIVVKKCNGLKYLLTPSMAKRLVRLKSLEVICCDQMKTIIGRPEIVVLEEEEEEENDIHLKYLCHIEVYDLPMLRMLCSESINLEFPSLDEFVVTFCPRMKKFCEGELLAPELKVVDCCPYGTVSIETMNNHLQECEYKKRCLNCAIKKKIDTCGHLDEDEEASSSVVRVSHGHLDEGQEASSRVARRQFIKARDLSIAWVDTHYWEWLPISDTNRTEIARLNEVCWFDIRAKVDTMFLSKRTDFIAYLVYDLQDYATNLDTVNARVKYDHHTTYDGEITTVFLTKKKSIGSEGPFATTRADGHLEIELGRFHTRDNYTGTDDRVVDILLFNHDNYTWKAGIDVLGVEVRSR